MSVIVEKCLNEETDFSQEELNKIVSGLIQHQDMSIIKQIETTEDKKKNLEYEEMLKSEVEKIDSKYKISEELLIEKYEKKEEALENQIKELIGKLEKKHEDSEIEIQIIKDNFQELLADEKANTYVTSSKVIISGVLVLLGIIYQGQLLQISKALPFLMFVFAILNIKFDRPWDKIRDYIKNRQLKRMGK